MTLPSCKRRWESAAGGGRKVRHALCVMAHCGPCCCHQNASCGHHSPPHHFLPHSPEDPLKTPHINIYTDPNNGSAGHWSGEPSLL